MSGPSGLEAQKHSALTTRFARDTEYTEGEFFFTPSGNPNGVKRRSPPGKVPAPKDHIRQLFLTQVPFAEGDGILLWLAPALWNAEHIALGSPGQGNNNFLCALCVSVVNSCL